MKWTVCGALCAAALGLVIASPAAAQRKPTIAIMPTQYFSADAESAENVTEGLVRQFEEAGYTVISMDESRQRFEAMNLEHNRHYPDRMALRFGEAVNADLVAYPRLLGVGIPAANADADNSLIEPISVLHLRVLNTHTNKPIYFNQIGHEFRAAREFGTEFTLPEPVAVATANEVLGGYFQRVAGSRQEYSGMR
ncbi:MAG: hypothetical protein ACK47B_21995 [Armatimonadota bacterium]